LFTLDHPDQVCFARKQSNLFGYTIKSADVNVPATVY
jgi:hypothetical protein